MRARQLMNVSSHTDLFYSLLLCYGLLQAVACTAKLSMAVSASLTIDLLRMRREAILDSTSQLSDNFEAILRSAPLQSKDLFGGLVSGLSQTHLFEQ